MPGRAHLAALPPRLLRSPAALVLLLASSLVLAACVSAAEVAQASCASEECGEQAAETEEVADVQLIQLSSGRTANTLGSGGEANNDLPSPGFNLPPWIMGGEIARRMLREEFAYRPHASAASMEQYWDALVDHFAPDWKTSGTFKQKFYADWEFYKEGGPVFFELGGEGPMRGPPGGFTRRLASERGALLVSVEHRFYGQSIPNGNVNSSNLKLLTVDQALADYAAFIDWFSVAESLPSGTKWFIFGGSYPGALASWFRIAYPDKSVGSLSSSGVVNAIFDFVMFDVHIARAIGPRCAEANRAITAAFESFVLARGEEETYAKGLFGCEPDMLDGDFFYMLADGLAMMVQYSSKSELCSNITGLDYESATPQAIMENAAALIKHYWGASFGTGCFYDTACLSDPAKFTVGATDRSWRWQKCYELAYLQPAPLPGELEDGRPLPKPLRSSLVNMSYMVDQCYAIFGEFNPVRGAIEESTARINAQFGGPQPKAKKVFYSNFADDPWMEASVMPPRDVDGEQPYEAALCDDCGHCMDLHTPKSSDPAELQHVRARFTKYLDAWLSGE